MSNKASMSVVNKLVEYQISCIKAADAMVNIKKPLSLAEKFKTIVLLIKELIQALQIIDDANTQKEVLEYVISKPKLYPALELIKLLAIIRSPELYTLLKTYILHILQNEIDTGLRNQDDWTIDAKSECNCEYCGIFNDFMNSRSEKNKIWPINQDIRYHIMSMIDELEVPIDYDTEEKGRPYKLLLAKSNSIHTYAKKRFEAVCSAYQQLSNES
ncbi:MAG: hypothetical protein SFT93_02695 [Rickettsiaceae bacterium]|nr:hypothetical protein [Rickettsiaceae bacterium]